MRDDESDVTEAGTAVPPVENIQNGPDNAQLGTEVDPHQVTPAVDQGANQAANQQAQVSQADGQPVTQAPVQTATTADSKPEHTAEEIQRSIDDFMELAKQASDQRDENSGEVPEAALAPVKIAYSKLPVPAAKTKVRAQIENNMREALSKELSAPKARAWMLIGQAVKATSSTGSTVARAAVDPTTAHVDRVLAIFLAPNLVTVPDGVASDWAAQVQSRGEALKGELATYKQFLVAHDAWSASTADDKGEEPKEPEVSQVIKDSARIARGRAAASRTRTPRAEGASTGAAGGPAYSGPRRSVAAHIKSAFDSVPSGTFMKVGDIVKHKSTEYGDDHPSGGAVTQALWPASGAASKVEGVKAEIRDGVKGAVKI